MDIIISHNQIVKAFAIRLNSLIIACKRPNAHMLAIASERQGKYHDHTASSKRINKRPIIHDPAMVGKIRKASVTAYR